MGEAIRADARHLPLPDASVDLVCTSPPYWSLRSYTDGGQHYGGQIGAEPTPREYIANLLEVTRECMRVLKPEGSIWVNLGDKYAGGGQGGNRGGNLTGGAHADRTTAQARTVPEGTRAKSLMGLPWRYAIGCMDELGLILRAEVIWSKSNGLPESVTDRVKRSHEHWFHLVTQPRYYAAVDEIRVPHSGKVHTGPTLAGLPRCEATDRRLRQDHAAGHPLGALPGSVWEVATQPLTVPERIGVDHYAAFPPALVRRIIAGWSPAGGIVLDPFGGTGTTALVASVLGRRGISVDASADYCRLAQWRTRDPGERARALGVPKPPPIPTGQASLFTPEEAPDA